MDDPQLRPLLTRRLRPGELMALDGLAAAAYTLLLVGFALSPGSPAPTGLALLTAAAVGLPLAARRRWPWPVFWVVLAASATGVLLGVVRDPFLAAAFALYLAALRTPRRQREPITTIAWLSLAGVAGTVLAAPVATGVEGSDSDGPGPGTVAGLAVLGCVLLGGAWTLGRAVRERRAYAARYAEQLARQAATEERLRIARELHDVVSHTLSLVGIKAGIANHVADQRPEEAREALRVIERTSREALTEMHRMLGLLRADQATEPGLADLTGLAQRAAAARVPVELEVRGAEALPAGVALTVHRIVQEAVTNVIKHAAPARCRVVVDGGGEGVRVEVTDDGRTAPASAGNPGHGLTGMRERVAAHGGRFRAGPLPEGGYAVSAWLPLAPLASA